MQDPGVSELIQKRCVVTVLKTKEQVEGGAGWCAHLMLPCEQVTQLPGGVLALPQAFRQRRPRRALCFQLPLVACPLPFR